MVIIFTVTHRFDDGFIYGQSFWMTVCSIVISTTTNITLIIDYIYTKDFSESGTLVFSALIYHQTVLIDVR